MQHDHPSADLVSHNFRGFDAKQGTLEGLRACLNAGVVHAECDVRLTKDNIPIVFHDPFFWADDGRKHSIAAWLLEDLRRQSSLKPIATLPEMAHAFAAQAGPAARLHVDVKIAGHEAQIVDCLKSAGILDRVVLVSWIGETLAALHQLAPQAPLGFSHISFDAYPGGFTLARLFGRPPLLGVASAFARPFSRRTAAELAAYRFTFPAEGNPLIPVAAADRLDKIHMHMLAHEVTGPLREAIRSSNGYVCLPRWCASSRLIAAYRRAGVRTAVYSARTAAELTTLRKTVRPDIIYVDNPRLFATADSAQ
jgi:glycerophosphoryl diester phosphodiesterase